MSFVAVFTALMTSFVLITPIAMAALLVRGGVPTRSAPALATPAPAPARTATAVSTRDLELSRAA